MDVSAVIPLHNSERWIGEAIQSLLCQKQEVRKIIVVNDASSDSGPEIARNYGGRVKLITGQWLNGNSARNRGLAEVEATWVQFLDADDLLTPGKISSQIACAAPETDVIYSPIIVRNEASGEESAQSLAPRADLHEQWIRWELCQTGAALWRTESLRKIGGWKEGLPCCQDNEVTLRALKSGLKFHYVDAPGAVYRIWSDETVCRKDPTKVIYQKTALIDDCLEWLEERGKLTRTHKLAAGQACFEMARTLARYDLSAANAYFLTRKQLGLISVTGPARSRRYEIIYRLMGFKSAEIAAEWAR